ncbi:MAG TPA: TonB-dependent siderophore receptor [Hyphomicrobiales bacterium]|nr:TonB-dependent siderophore receptor [Hyphomicrobiales bacterium]
MHHPEFRMLVAARPAGLKTLAGAIVLLLCPPASAQEQAAATAPITLPPLTVSTLPVEATAGRTGTKADIPLIETPQSISVVTREQLEDRAATTVGQALRYTPGVVAEWRGLSSGKYDHIVVRGSAGYTVDAYWDGLKIPGMGSIGGASPDPYFLERVEVLRGPASVLYGQGATNGLVHLVSKLPASAAARELRLTAGSFGYGQLALDFTGPVDGNGRLFYRLVGVGLDTDSPVDRVHERRIGIAPSLTWRPDAATSLTLSGNYQHDPDLGYYDTRPVIGTALPNPLGQVPENFFAGEPGVDASDRSHRALGYAFEHRFGENWSFRQNLRQVAADYDWQVVAFQSLRPDNRTANRYYSRIVRSGTGLQLDNQLQGRITGMGITHTVLIGLDHQREDFDNITYAGSADPIDIFAPVYGGAVNIPAQPRGNARQKSRQNGFYLQDQIRHNRLALLLSARRDHTANRSYNRPAAQLSEASDQASTWRAGAVYLFDNGFAPYLSHAESFQPVSGFDAAGRPFQPARGKQLELGTRWQSVSGNTLFSLAVFRLDEDNLSMPDHNNPGFSIQLGAVGTRGVELEGNFSPFANLHLQVSYSHLDSEIQYGSAQELGNSRPNVPENSASLWADYAFPGVLNGFEAGLGLRYVGASPANTANSFSAPSYTLADLALHYDLGRANEGWRGAQLDLNVKNLLDEDYVGSCGGASVAGGYCWAGYPRTLSATLSYHW